MKILARRLEWQNISCSIFNVKLKLRLVVNTDSMMLLQQRTEIK